MKKAVLLGTGHNIQRGDDRKDCFQAHIRHLCMGYKVKAIAEEIDDRTTSIAQQIACELDIAYKIIEPNEKETESLGIELWHKIFFQIMNKYEIEPYSKEPYDQNMPPLAYKEYSTRMEKTYRDREAEWLRRIEMLDTWPVLIICGASHYQPFCKLLVSRGI
jgi:hypothetical protein